LLEAVSLPLLSENALWYDIMPMELEGMIRLFYALLRSHICDVIRCSEPDHERLRASLCESRWVRALLRVGRVSERDIKWCLASAKAKRESRAKENISLLLAYELSHSAELDPRKRKKLLALIGRGGVDLKDIECEDLIGAQLTQEEIWALFGGKQVKFRREKAKLEEAFHSISLEF